MFTLLTDIGITYDIQKTSAYSTSNRVGLLYTLTSMVTDSTITGGGGGTGAGDAGLPPHTKD